VSINTEALSSVANTIRGLSIDAIEAANSGHPGLPLGCAELVAYLYGHGMSYHPHHPDWINRDRFVLSAGHGSMVLYSALHLAGFNLSLDDIKNFRQLHSKTAGHPEYGEADGIETTTGPLGQGLATAVGMALSQKMAAAQTKSDLFNATTYVLAGDGCLMEGVSAEASSFAGHLNLDNLVVIYDSNDICLDGPTSECFTEDTAKRYEAYGWFVQTIDGHSFDMIHNAVEAAKQAEQPSLIVAKTIIGKGAPTVQGTSESHGKALGPDEAKKAKEAFNIPTDDLFYVPESVPAFFKQHQETLTTQFLDWQEQFQAWNRSGSEHANQFNQCTAPINTAELFNTLDQLALAPNKATRSQSAQLLQVLAQHVPQLVGGSADLSCSDNTYLKNFDMIQAGAFNGRNIKYGVREFAMAAMASGLVLGQVFRPYVGTFLMFSDYMRNAIRLAALMNIPVMYQFTHDSVFLGEDGPTHQPVEHLASLRAMPNLTVCRPADENEVKAAWYLGVTRQSPTAIVLSRQNIQSLEQTSFKDACKGGYVLKESSPADVTLFSTGSECSLALEVAKVLDTEGISARVVSLLSWEVFAEQSDDYKQQVVGESKLNVSIEAQSSFGWERFIGTRGIAISVDSFGISAKYSDIKQHFGFSLDTIIQRVKTALSLVQVSS
jgi:transketolase